MTWIVGVDGCPAGWIAAFAPLDDLSTPLIRVVARFSDIVHAPEMPSVIVVDMPIGLPERIEGPGRAPEMLVRPLLGKGSSSVFSMCSRSAVYEKDYDDAKRTALETSSPGKMMTIQAFNIMPKIVEIDTLLRQDGRLVGKVFEGHPEVIFHALNGAQSLVHKKKTKEGQALRRTLLRQHGLGLACVGSKPPRGAAADDQLDALACLVTARAIAMGHAQSYPSPPERDAHNIPIAIWAPKPHKRGSKPETRSMPAPSVSRAEIDAAAARIAPHARVTPVLELPRGALGGDWTPVLKLELLQHAGSFKTRGAFNSLLSLPVPTAGVSAASGGNHGAAVAYAARELGFKARIFVPEISPAAKVETIRRFGAEVVIGGAQYDDAQAACDAYVAKTGALKIHPFSATATIAGQGTLAREWERQASVDSVLIAVGGGGLVSGAAAWWAGQPMRVIAVEPEGSRALQAALMAGGPTEVTVQSIAADSLGARNVGQLVHDVCQGNVEEVVLVPDSAIRAAQKTLWQDFRLATEPGGAAAFAAILSGAYRPAPGERVGILLCGANVEPAKLQDVLA